MSKIPESWNDSLYLKLKNGWWMRMGVDMSRWENLSECLEKARKDLVSFPFVDADGNTHSAVNGHAIIEMKIGTWEGHKRPESIRAGMKGSEDWIISTFFHFIDGYQEIENSASDYKALAREIADQCPLMDIVEYQTLNGPVSIDMSDVMGYNMQASKTCMCPIDKVMARGCRVAARSTIKDQRCPSRGSLERVVGSRGYQEPIQKLDIHTETLKAYLESIS